MPYPFPNGRTPRGRLKSASSGRRKQRSLAVGSQPTPRTPDISKQMVREHARRMFRDKWPNPNLTAKEWRLAEEDLVRLIEAEAL